MTHDQRKLDLSHVFDLEPHGPETYVGESPKYSWGRIYGGLVVAQALWAATNTVEPRYAVHSLHAYFILGGDLREPVRYEVDRVRNGRSFTTRRVVARQSAGAILTLECSYQIDEEGPNLQSTTFPSDIPEPQDLEIHFDAGAERCDVKVPQDPPRSTCWARFPVPLGEDPRRQACGLAYLSDVNAMGAVHASFPGDTHDDDTMMGASLDHSIWFQRPVRSDDWVLLDMRGHGMIGSRGLATGLVFHPDGTHVGTIVQEGLLRKVRKPAKG
ncbi:MAG: acyl-CoA thioesterase II [bacterium]|nr:acyl-CoA thioesterase II [bacterium]